MTGNPAAWIGLGFVATAANAAPSVIRDMGPIEIVCPQIAFGLGYPENDPELSAARDLIAGLPAYGLGAAGWAWCCYPERAAEEARHHAAVALDLGLGMFVANMEEPYDAHGDSGNPKMWAPDEYAQAFREAAPELELGLTTTPRWGSSGNEMRAAGATTMPQAFTGEVPSATIPAAVEHAESWGWTRDRIRPLVQVYKTNELRPDAGVYLADAAAYEVGVVPYILEQAFDGEGIDMIRTLAPAITRPPAASSTPPPTEELPPPTEEIKPPPTAAGDAPELPFARALYPPDAKAEGKTPSPDGPDVQAVKRAISRAGYWRWQTFDEVYSNGFAHGRDGDGEGLEGFQHDHVDLQGKPPSGWYGSASHEALRTFVLPAGPHAGEYAFDSVACDLYRQAGG